MKKVCPYCAEDIQKQAIVCPHCQRDLTFFKPIEERIEKMEQAIVALSQQVDELASLGDDRETTSRNSGYIYIISITFSTIVSVGLYAVYILIESSRPISLWISIVMPLLAGTWLGYKVINRTIINYIVVGIVTGTLTAAGIALCVAVLSRQSGQVGVDWGAVFRLYFLPPIFLITFGGFAGEWFHNINNPKPPTYALDIAKILSRASKTRQEDQIDHLAKIISAITPILTLIGSIITASLAYYATISN